jgi:hypothetical protein
MAGLDDLFTDCGSLANGVTVRGERIRRKVKDIGPISVRVSMRPACRARLIANTRRRRSLSEVEKRYRYCYRPHQLEPTHHWYHY